LIFLDFKKPLSRLAQKILHRIRFFVVLVVVLLTVATTVRVIDPFLVSALRQLTFDWYQRLHPESYDPDSPVRIVDIDEASLSKIGQWPWPRTVLGDLLADLADKGAAVVGFDVLFVEPDRSSIEEIAKRLPAAQASSLLQIAAGQRSNDQVFADALRDSPSVLGISLSNGPTSLAHAKAGFAIAGDDPRQFIPSFSGDRDQIVRRVPLLYRVGAELVPSFAAEVLRVRVYCIRCIHARFSVGSAFTAVLGHELSF
jgi:adenylate cyclase